ncbi:MAG: hypothetical protein SV201_05840 [Pseudomonadota bacterium]|nr:hypothetical protein [Pseudomonadota bacterium]
MPHRTRQCPRCAEPNSLDRKTCWLCHSPLRQTRFHMSKDKIKYIHTLAMRQKGLSREEYEANLQAVGVASSKDMKRQHYYQFLQRMKALPDVRR